MIISRMTQDYLEVLLPQIFNARADTLRQRLSDQISNVESDCGCTLY